MPENMQQCFHCLLWVLSCSLESSSAKDAATLHCKQQWTVAFLVLIVSLCYLTKVSFFISMQSTSISMDLFSSSKMLRQIIISFYNLSILIFGKRLAVIQHKKGSQVVIMMHNFSMCKEESTFLPPLLNLLFFTHSTMLVTHIERTLFV